MGMMVAELFGDDVQYDEEELWDIAERQGYAKTRVRFFAEYSVESGQPFVYGLHAVEGTRYDEVRVRKMDWDDTHKHYVMKERNDSKPLIIWTPILDDKDKFKVPGRPDQSGTFNQPTIYVNPIQSFNGKNNPQGFPLLDLKNFNDYILVFPADSGMPPIYVYFSKVFRGDDTYAGGSIGQPKEGNITAEDIIKHVEAKGDGRLTSFSEKIKSSPTSRGANYFTSKGKIVKVELESLELLSEQGEISVITKEQAREIIRGHSKSKIKDRANGVYQTMNKNNEVLIHGQIPAQYIKPVK